jgi:hypothetical protein
MQKTKGIEWAAQEVSVKVYEIEDCDDSLSRSKQSAFSFLFQRNGSARSKEDTSSDGKEEETRDSGSETEDPNVWTSTFGRKTSISSRGKGARKKKDNHCVGVDDQEEEVTCAQGVLNFNGLVDDHESDNDEVHFVYVCVCLFD